MFCFYVTSRICRPSPVRKDREIPKRLISDSVLDRMLNAFFVRKFLVAARKAVQAEKAEATAKKRNELMLDQARASG